MNKILTSFFILFVLLVAGGCAIESNETRENKNKKILTIEWQRLIDESGQTCQRCEATGKEVQRAYYLLKQSLIPLGIGVALEKKALDPATCAKDISQSNRIWVDKRPLEEWLGAQVGKSLCGFCCAELGDSVECRTIKVGEKTYEVVSGDLIIKAGLLAAAQLFTVGTDELCCKGGPVTESCCKSGTSIQTPCSGSGVKSDSNSNER